MTICDSTGGNGEHCWFTGGGGGGVETKVSRWGSVSDTVKSQQQNADMKVVVVVIRSSLYW